MSLLIAILVFLLFSGGFFLMMRRHTFEVLLGTLLLSHATNLFIIAMGGWSPNEEPPIVSEHGELPVQMFADPIPQALVLTAIVIGFGVTAFLVVLIARGIEETKSERIGELGRGENEP